MNQALTQGRLAPAPQTTLPVIHVSWGRLASWVVLLVLYVVWPAFQIVDYVAAQPFVEALDVVNYAASIAAYNWLLLNVLLGLKLPLLQRAFPYDLRIRAHIITTGLVTAFIAWHATYYFFLNPKQITVVTWSVLGTFVGLLTLSLAWVPLPGFRWMARISHGKGWAYDLLKAAHKGVYVVLAALVYVHVLDSKIVEVVSPLAGAGFGVFFALVVVAFVAARLNNLWLPRLRVASVTTNGSVVHLSLEPGRLRYRPGQFAFLRFDHPDLRGEEHPFSFTSVPGDPTDFAIKSVGDFTTKVSHLKPGDTVRVNGGFGAFRPRRSVRPLVLIGTGIGAAPLVSLLKDLGRRPPLGPVYAFVAASSRADLVEPEFWDTIADRVPGLHLTVLLSDRGDPVLSREVLAQVPGHRDAEYLMCSSPRVRNSVLQALGGLGVPRKRIRFEALNLS